MQQQQQLLLLLRSSDVRHAGGVGTVAMTGLSPAVL
jgi:hypothetical protein